MRYLIRRVALLALVAALLQSSSVQTAHAADGVAAGRGGWREWVCGILCGAGALYCCSQLPVICEYCGIGGIMCVDYCVDALNGESENECEAWVEELEEVYPCEAGA